MFPTGPNNPNVGQFPTQIPTQIPGQIPGQLNSGMMPPSAPTQYNPGQIHQPTKQYNDILTPICQFGFSFNHLLTIVLMKRDTNTPNVKDLKEHYFFFVTLIPGVGDKSNRTYDFKQKIAMKYSLRELASFIFVLKQCSIGNDNAVLPYRKFSRQQSISKNCSIWSTNAVKNAGQPTQTSNKAITISFEINQTKFHMSLSPADAAGIAETLQPVMEKGLKLEIDYQINIPKSLNNNSGSNYNELPSINNSMMIEGGSNIPNIGVISNLNNTSNLITHSAPTIPNTNVIAPASNFGFNVAPPTINSNQPSNLIPNTNQSSNFRAFPTIDPPIPTSNVPTPNPTAVPNQSSDANTLAQFGQMLTNITS